MVSKDAVMAVFVVSVMLALGIQFYQEVYAAYLQPGAGNVSTQPLNETRRREVLGEGYVVVTYYYRSDCAPCREQTPVMEELARELNDTVFLLKLNAASFPDANVTTLPTVRVEGPAAPPATIEGPAGAGRVMREVIRAMRSREDAARSP